MKQSKHSKFNYLSKISLPVLLFLFLTVTLLLCLSCNTKSDELYDFRTHTIMDDPEDYTYLQENWDVLLETLGNPPEGGAQIVERQANSGGQSANLVLEDGVKCYSVRAEHLLYWLRHGGLMSGVTQSRDFTWYFPVYDNAEGLDLITLNHRSAVPQLEQPETYSISLYPSIIENDDGTAGYAFHPERVQELLDENGITNPRILLPLSGSAPQKDGELFDVQAVYIESDQGVWLIPYSGSWRSDGMYYKRLHLYTKEEFEEILAFHVSELDPAEPIPWNSNPGIG